MKDIAIKFKNIEKEYPLYKNDFDRLRSFSNPKRKPQKFVALKNINFEVKKGKIIGIIGVNGSGKSTISNIIAGVSYQSKGEAYVDGDVNILAASSGLENHLTGIENIDFKCTLLGFSQKEIDAMKNDIIEFADIGVHINQPLRTYSSGMRSRLGFAISIHMEPEILIIDEGLAVGDTSFYDKCIDKMNEITKSGKTIVFVTHSVPSMKDFCDEILWVHKGAMVGCDVPEKIIMPYCGFARDFAGMTNEERAEHQPKLEYYQKKYL